MFKASPQYKFPTELKEAKYEIEEHALAFGLDFFQIIFEVLDYQELNEVAAYLGFPSRYPHWRFGMEYDKLSKSYAYGLARISEMVINNDPCFAYLLKCNNMVDQKLVMAHVYGHCDFFKNNLFFAHTNRKMVDEMANHAIRIQRYVDRYGTEAVEAFIDCCLSLENLIDVHAPFIKRRDDVRPETTLHLAHAHAPSADDDSCSCQGDGDGASTCAKNSSQGGSASCQGNKAEEEELFGDEDDERVLPQRLRSKGYMDTYINPSEFLEARAKEMKAKLREKKRFPENPVADVLLFLAENVSLTNWQRDILSIIREEAYYYLPQGQTKIMNEGWATYWHSRIMTEKVLKDDEIIDYADHHSGTVGGPRLRLNPYKLGLELFRDIEERWDKGRFGKEYEECEDLVARESWDKELGLGREKIFEVRHLYNDLTFIDTFLTEEFCRKHKLFVFAKDDKNPVWVIKTRELEQVKEMILNGLTNLGRPLIKVADGNFENRGELLLTQEREGRDLKWDFADDTLVNLHRLWKRPVHLETIREGKKVLLSFAGEKHEVKNLN
ncbi:MAG: SpoVR family protein [Desulfatiglandales bacterium]